MRIVTWNCGMALARKASSLLALKPDIAVVQECSKKSVDDLRSHGLSGLWFGSNVNKGVAVFCSKGWNPEVVDAPFGKWVIPVRVHGSVEFNLLAIWACPVGTKRADSYIGEVHRCLVKHPDWFTTALPVVVAGDFNSNDSPQGSPSTSARWIKISGTICPFKRKRNSCMMIPRGQSPTA
jgi:exodeoxyribonuclease III